MAFVRRGKLDPKERRRLLHVCSDYCHLKIVKCTFVQLMKRKGFYTSIVGRERVPVGVKSAVVYYALSIIEYEIEFGRHFSVGALSICVTVMDLVRVSRLGSFPSGRVHGMKPGNRVGPRRLLGP